MDEYKSLKPNLICTNLLESIQIQNVPVAYIVGSLILSMTRSNILKFAASAALTMSLGVKLKPSEHLNRYSFLIGLLGPHLNARYSKYFLKSFSNASTLGTDLSDLSLFTSALILSRILRQWNVVYYICFLNCKNENDKLCFLLLNTILHLHTGINRWWNLDQFFISKTNDRTNFPFQSVCFLFTHRHHFQIGHENSLTQIVLAQSFEKFVGLPGTRHWHLTNTNS